MTLILILILPLINALAAPANFTCSDVFLFIKWNILTLYSTAINLRVIWLSFVLLIINISILLVLLAMVRNIIFIIWHLVHVNSPRFLLWSDFKIICALCSYSYSCMLFSIALLVGSIEHLKELLSFALSLLMKLFYLQTSFNLILDGNGSHSYMHSFICST